MCLRVLSHEKKSCIFVCINDQNLYIHATRTAYFAIAYFIFFVIG